MPDNYHLRRTEKAIESRDEMLGIIGSRPHMTLAMCSEMGPYLVTLNHAFDRDRMCVYFHCAGEGRKVDCIRFDPNVWGQVMEDLGYIDGECDWGYRTVHFWGKAEFVSDIDEKRHALGLLVAKLERDVEDAKERHITESGLSKVLIGKVALVGFTGKQRLLGGK